MSPTHIRNTMDNIFYSIRNGKNPKYSYYLKSYFLRLLPLKAICRKRLNKILAQANTRSDKNYINDRVNYYNRLIEPVKLPEGSPCLNELKLQKKGKSTTSIHSNTSGTSPKTCNGTTVSAISISCPIPLPLLRAGPFTTNRQMPYY